ncbi:hypothetical protein LSUB1_G002761 [Lachnellula subtilissima]|uniref:Uncharacterized protein n=1 Tax=Lachnellula subtilissima TaxID=602034 RepID=A0A8H8U8D5_9HELO|nr:hypothetical protein LSUB1_G002761 [Lachnellula subtilissima]
MPGLPAYRQSQFPDDKPPTLFSPASPKNKSSKSAKVMDDGASTMTTSSFSSTVGLIKSKLPSYKDRKDRKSSESENKVLKDSKSPKARTAEAYMYISMNK